MSEMCPKCGYNLVADRLISIGDLVHDPRGRTWWKGKEVHIPPGESIVLTALVQARGRLVGYDTFAEVLDTNSVNIKRMVSVYICRLRRYYLPGIEFGNVHGRGYYWSIDNVTKSEG